MWITCCALPGRMRRTELRCATSLPHVDTSPSSCRLPYISFVLQAAISLLAQKLRCPQHVLATAGTKDKRAVTFQHVTGHMVSHSQTETNYAVLWTSCG